MKERDTLHELIRAMTRSEKAFFKKFQGQSSSGVAGHILLFDLLNKMERYDERKIQKLFKENYSEEHSRFIKNYLKKTILRSLRAFREEQSPDTALSESLINVELLFNKKLYPFAEKELQRGEKILEIHELFYRFSEVAYWKRRLLYNKGYSLMSLAEMEALNSSELLYQKKTENNSSYYLLSFKVLEYAACMGTIRNHNTKKKLQELFGHRLLMNEQEALSTSAKCFFYNLNCLYCDLIYDTEGLLLYMKKNILLIENNSIFLENNRWRYAVALYNYTVTLLSLGRTNEISSPLSKLKRLKMEKKIDSLLLKNNIEILIVNIEMRYIIRTGHFKKGTDVENTYGDFLLDQDLKNKPHVLVENLIMMAYSHLMAGNFRSALKWNNIMLNSRVEGLRTDLFTLCRILNLLIHFELGNDVLIIYKIKSTQRFLEKNESLKDFESLMLRVIRILLDADRENGLNQLLLLKIQIEQLKKDDFERQAFALIDLTCWIDKKIQGLQKKEGTEISQNFFK